MGIEEKEKISKALRDILRRHEKLQAKAKTVKAAILQSNELSDDEKKEWLSQLEWLSDVFKVEEE